MNSFESLVATLLRRDGYWVRQSFKVDLTRADKQAIRRPSSPRWELDLVAYKAESNIIRIVECKSYLDSVGVTFQAFDKPHGKHAARYKLFNEPTLRKIVFARTVDQLLTSGACRPHPRVELCLACGKIKNETDRSQLQKLFTKNRWLLFDDDWIRRRLRSLASDLYEDDVATVVAKLLLKEDLQGNKK